MKISCETGSHFAIVRLEAQTEEESVFLVKFFQVECKELAKKFPLKKGEVKK